jgi:hypothetical protein
MRAPPHVGQVRRQRARRLLRRAWPGQRQGRLRQPAGPARRQLRRCGGVRVRCSRGRGDRRAGGCLRRRLTVRACGRGVAFAVDGDFRAFSRSGLNRSRSVDRGRVHSRGGRGRGGGSWTGQWRRLRRRWLRRRQQQHQRTRHQAQLPRPRRLRLRGLRHRQPRRQQQGQYRRGSARRASWPPQLSAGPQPQAQAARCRPPRLRRSDSTGMVSASPVSAATSLES